MTAGVGGAGTGGNGIIRPGKSWQNWGRTVTSHPAYVARPTSVAEVVSVVDFARDSGLRLKPIGAGHSFSPIAATDGVLLDLDGLRGVLAVDGPHVTLAAGTYLHELPALLAPYGLAFQNLGDIDRQTIGGATSTGTHGTGAAYGGLATRITGLTLVTADGSILRIDDRENAGLLPAAALGLGALGVLVDVTVECVPAFLLSAVERAEPFEAVVESWLERVAATDHFEFYVWPHTDTVTTKANTRLPATGRRAPVGALAGWWEDRFMSNAVLEAICTVGRIAPALTPPINRLATRLTGNRDYTDDSQSVFVAPRTTRFREMEYAVPLADVPEVLREVRAAIDRHRFTVSFPIEVRAAAADDLLLSTASGRATGYVAVHRHWRDDPTEYFRTMEQIMRSHGGRPHWGKMHSQNADTLREAYPGFGAFVAVRDRLDPERLFGNAYLDRVLGSDRAAGPDSVLGS